MSIQRVLGRLLEAVINGQKAVVSTKISPKWSEGVGMTTVNPDKYGQGGGSRDGIRKHGQVVSSRVKYDEVYESIVSLVKYGDGGTGSVKSVKYGKKVSCIANLNTLACTLNPTKFSQILCSWNRIAIK